MGKSAPIKGNKWQQLLIGEWSWWRLGRSLLFIYTCFALYVFFFADRMIFVPQPPSYSDTPSTLKLTTPNGEKISAIYLPNSGAKFTILYSHGNAEDLGDIEPILSLIQEAGFNVFAYDYRGYGTSEGQPTEQNTYQDIETAYNYLTQFLKVAPDRLILLGRSVGGGPSTNLALKRPIAGLILESTFTQAFRVVVPFPLLPFDKFTNLTRIRQIKEPVLIIHGTEDTTIPFNHGEQLWQGAPEPKFFYRVEGATHNDLPFVAGKRYGATLNKFALQIK